VKNRDERDDCAENMLSVAKSSQHIDSLYGVISVVEINFRLRYEIWCTREGLGFPNLSNIFACHLKLLRIVLCKQSVL